MKWRMKVLVVLLATAMIAILDGCSKTAIEPETVSSDVKNETMEEKTDFPTHNITMIVPFGAGGNADLLARAVAEQANKVMGVSMGVENRTGGGGIVGLSEFIAKEPTGYDVITVSVGLFAVTPLTKEVPYSFDDVIPIIGNIGKTTPVLCVAAKTGIKTWGDFLEYAQGKTIKYAAVGIGSEQHLAQAALYAKAGISADVVSYDTAPETIAAVLNGDADILWSLSPNMKDYVETGEIVAIAALNPDVEIRYENTDVIPTTKSLGYDVTFSGFNFYCVPAGTPEYVTKYLTEKMAEIYETPEIKELADSMGFVVDPLTPEEITAAVEEMISSGKEWKTYIE